jgi:hypothetical protein
VRRFIWRRASQFRPAFELYQDGHLNRLLRRLDPETFALTCDADVVEPMTTLTVIRGDLTSMRQHQLHQFVITPIVFSPQLGQSMTKASELSSTSPATRMGSEPLHLATTKHPG